ncbi:MAG: glycosyltransferase family 39 protein [bacterium]
MADKCSRRRFWLSFSLILAGAAALRFIQIGRLEMWLDECCSVLTAFSPEGIIKALRYDNSPPLYFFMLKTWMAAFGAGAVGVRALSAVAGVLTVAVLGLWLRDFGMPRRVCLWAMLLMTLAPLQIHYSQETRMYAPATLFVVCACWGLTRALRVARSGGVSVSSMMTPWCAHGAFVLASLLTHDLGLVFIPAYWLAARIMRPPRGAFGALLAAHAVAAALYLPWLAHVIQQPKTDALAWAAPAWRATSSWLFIPLSLEALGVGGWLPPYIRIPSPAPAVCAASSAWFILLGVCAAAQWWRKRGYSRQIAVFGILGAAPLVFLFVYSVLWKPVYVVGRYDVLSQPFYLSIMAVGAHVLQLRLALRSRLLAVAALWGVTAALALAALAPRYAAAPPGLATHPQGARGEYLARHAEPDDLVVCLDLEGAKIAYQMLLRGIRAGLVTFPFETRRHFGWADAEGSLKGDGPEKLRAEAQSIMNLFKPPAARHKRLWIFQPPASRLADGAGPGGIRRGGRARIADILLSTAKDNGMIPAKLSPDNLGILVMIPGEIQR